MLSLRNSNIFRGFSMNFKHILLGILLLLGATFALTVNSPEPVQTVVGGEAIAFELVLAGNDETVDLTVDSELPVSLSQFYGRC